MGLRVSADGPPGSLKGICVGTSRVKRITNILLGINYCIESPAPLPMDDAVSFKDSSKRKIDTELKKIYTSARSACKPSLALTSVAKATGAWAQIVEAELSTGAGNALMVKILAVPG